MASSEEKGGTRSCSFASSSAISRGSRSRRVEQQLAELDEDRPQVFQRLAQAHGARRREIAPEHQALRREQKARAETALQFVLEDQTVEPVEVGNAGNADEAEDAHGGPERTGNGKYNSRFIGITRKPRKDSA